MSVCVSTFERKIDLIFFFFFLLSLISGCLTKLDAVVFVGRYIQSGMWRTSAD